MVTIKVVTVRGVTVRGVTVSGHYDIGNKVIVRWMLNEFIALCNVISRCIILNILLFSDDYHYYDYNLYVLDILYVLYILDTLLF